MSQWDVFIVRDFEQLVGLDESKVLEMIAAGRLTGDDCVRPSGEQTWQRVATLTPFCAELDATQPAFGASRPEPLPRSSTAQSAPEPPPTERVKAPPPIPLPTERATPPPRTAKAPPVPASPRLPDTGTGAPASPRRPDAGTAPPAEAPAAPVEVALAETFEPILTTEDDDADEATEWANADRRTHRDSEELDLTAMVDVTFLLVLFFMLTATFSIQKSLSMPEPNPEEKAARQTIVDLDDLRENHVVVTILGDNSLMVDDDPVPADQLVGKLQDLMRATGKNELVVVADDAAFHETVVRVYDAGNEVGMQRIRLGAAAGFAESE